ncbi:MAG: Na/Pi cotransporter family protein [Magnetococcales bacterium]|nr:Na/Pi cotransporter family protein [Magnetococcales bacterium]
MFDSKYISMCLSCSGQLMPRIISRIVPVVAFLMPWNSAWAADQGSEMAWGWMTMTLLGGLALFLYGMEMMSKALELVAGDHMKSVLGKLTTNRFIGVLTGALVTAVIQSSSITTLLVVGFISAGLMSLAQAIPIIFGANVGTTITAQIVAFKVTDAAHLMIACGLLLGQLGKREHVKQYGWMLMGLGLVFFGMSLMSDAMKPLRSFQPFLDFMIRMESPWMGLLVSLLFTSLIQSSSATTGIVIVMASQGFITLPAGIALAFGANVGTCVTALLAAIGKPREAVRAALAHVLFNTLGVLIWYPAIDWLALVVTNLSPTAEHLTGMARLAEETPRQIANAHTIFNVLNTVLFLPFVQPFTALVSRLLPDRKDPVGMDAAMPVRTAIHLSEALLITPALALDAVRRELKSMGMRVALMLHDTMPLMLHGDNESLRELDRRKAVIDLQHRQIIHYLGQINQTPMLQEDSQDLLGLVRVANALENVGDVIGTYFVNLGEQRIRKQITIPPESAQRIRATQGEIIKSIHLVLEAYLKHDQDALNKLTDIWQALERLFADDSDQLLQRLSESKSEQLDIYHLEMDILDRLGRIQSLVGTIFNQAKAIQQNYRFSAGGVLFIRS